MIKITQSYWKLVAECHILTIRTFRVRDKMSFVCACALARARVRWKLWSNITTINTKFGLCVTILQVFKVNFSTLESNFYIWYQQVVHHFISVLPTYNNHISRGNFLTRTVLPYIIFLNPLRTTSSSTFTTISRIKGVRGKVHPCADTEALYRPYGPQGE